MRREGAVCVLAICMSLGLLAGAPPAAAQHGWRHEAGEWSMAAAALGGAYLLDVRLRDAIFVHADTTIPRLARLADPLGRPTTYVPVLAVLYGTGLASGNDGLSRGALHAAGALAAAELGTRGLKFIVGRGRPDTGGTDGDEFRLLTLDGEWSSFPSGHATTAFALATAVDWEVEDPWVSAAAYGAATVVAWSRVRQNRHWTSDVVGGALVGVFVSEVALRWMGEHEDNGSHDGGGLPVALQFAIPTP